MCFSSTRNSTKDSTSSTPPATKSESPNEDATAEGTRIIAENVVIASDAQENDASDEGIIYMSADDDDDEAEGSLLEVEEDEEEFEDDEDAIRDAIQRAADMFGGDTDLLQGLNPATLPPEVRALLEATAGLSVLGSSSQGSKWRLLGIYPHNPYIDEVADAQDIHQLIPLQYHSFSPFIGSFCAAYPSYTLSGKEIPLKFPDLSHFNIPLSAIRSAKLIDLPHSYTDLYHMVSTAQHNIAHVALSNLYFCYYVVSGTLPTGREWRISRRSGYLSLVRISHGCWYAYTPYHFCTSFPTILCCNHSRQQTQARSRGRQQSGRVYLARHVVRRRQLHLLRAARLQGLADARWSLLLQSLHLSGRERGGRGGSGTQSPHALVPPALPRLAADVLPAPRRQGGGPKALLRRHGDQAALVLASPVSFMPSLFYNFNKCHGYV
ncbi:hypothetical protein EON65_20590 [archaeon]|nr:MAG: hypothetical protein EON65_20590 [archaeon]